MNRHKIANLFEFGVSGYNNAADMFCKSQSEAIGIRNGIDSLDFRALRASSLVASTTSIGSMSMADTKRSAVQGQPFCG